MEHVVFFPAPDGTQGFRRTPDRAEAVRLVEHLRNVEGIERVTVHELTEVPLSFRAYYHVQVPTQDESAPAPREQVVAPVIPLMMQPVPAAPVALLPVQPQAHERLTHEPPTPQQPALAARLVEPVVLEPEPAVPSLALVADPEPGVDEPVEQEPADPLPAEPFNLAGDELVQVQDESDDSDHSEHSDDSDDEPPADEPAGAAPDGTAPAGIVPAAAIPMQFAEPDPVSAAPRHCNAPSSMGFFA